MSHLIRDLMASISDRIDYQVEHDLPVEYVKVWNPEEESVCLFPYSIGCGQGPSVLVKLGGSWDLVRIFPVLSADPTASADDAFTVARDAGKELFDELCRHPRPAVTSNRHRPPK